MRKVTGYIGALIIVMALMGSILAGYALNVNGESVVVNKYEKVTDVSGLYTHTDEKSYIEYNPADNYIGYDLKQSDTFTIDNPNGAGEGLKYKLYKNTSTSGSWSNYQYAAGAFYDNNGAIVPFSTTANQSALTIYRIMVSENATIYSYAPNGTNSTVEIRKLDNGLERYWSDNVSINFNGSTISLTFNNQTITTASSWLLIPSASGDYVTINNGTGYYQTGQMYVEPGASVTSTPITEWNGEPTYNLYSVSTPYSNSYIFLPDTVQYQPLNYHGVNYTESNRVNNYPMEIDTTDMSGYITRSLNLQAMSTTNYASNDTWDIGLLRVDQVTPPFVARFTVSSPILANGPPTGIYSYKLSDILSTITIPQFATQIRIDAPAEYNITASYRVGTQYSGSFTLPDNFVVIGTEAGTVSYNVLTDQSVMNRTAYYNISTGMVDIYTSGGVRVGTGTPDQIYVQFVTNNATTGVMYDNVGGYYPIYSTSPSRPQPYLNLAITTSGTITNIHYMDVTKGVSIKSGSPGPIDWNNGYENGMIKLLFRAEDVGATYHNEFTVSGNTISVDYATGRFYVTLNGGEAVDIGTWRNIVLNIDLLHGELSVNPVRTFNNYTNVVTDNATITVGNLTGTPTNIIEWEPTSNSFRFNVYSTDVFMNTYGVVMVNPELNITDYFTDLNQFYKLDFYNFSVYGDSITANGVTGTVSGNTITFNDESFILKELAVIYADGHAYVEDSHISLDLGAITTNIVQFGGVWYFQTDLLKGYTAAEQVYEWNWSDFILDNTQFCVFYIGLAAIGLIVARKFCTLSVIDYAVFITSIIIALSVQVIA